MKSRITLLIAACLVLFPTIASAQYNESAGVNAPKQEKIVDVLDADGEVRKRRVKHEVTKNQYGNAAGNQYDLAVDGAFDGQTVAVLHFYTLENFDFSLPKKALAQKGFSTFRWVNTAPEPAELRKKLKKACQLWIISDSTRHLNEKHLAVIKDFFESGRGVYIWGDNQPYYSDANFIAEGLFGASMHGNLPGGKVVGLKQEGSKGGVRKGHLLTTGLEHIFEGITIATLETTEDFEPLIWGSANNLVTAVYEKDGKRAIIDGGFTRLYLHWDTAGTARYVKNAAAWLTNYERFGDDVVAAKHREE